MVCTTSLSDSRCWTLTVLSTSMPASSSSLDVLPALLRRAGDVGVRQLVDQHDLGPAGEHGVDVELLERRPAVGHGRRGSTSRPSSSAAVCGRPCVSTKPTTTSVPRSRRRCASLSIAYVLPTPGAAPR